MVGRENALVTDILIILIVVMTPALNSYLKLNGTIENRQFIFNQLYLNTVVGVYEPTNPTHLQIQAC